MGLFQALLLAASLGCSSVLAEPQNNGAHNDISSLPPSIPPPSSPPANPHPSSATHDGGHFTAESPVTLITESSLVYFSPITMQPESSLAKPTPPSHPSGGPPGPPHNPPHPSNPPPSPPTHPSPSQPPPGSSGGILIDTAPTPTEIKTYFVNGRPIIAGHSETVIKGTTYSLASSGSSLYANGQATRVSNAIVDAQTSTRGAAASSSGAGLRVAGASASASASAQGSNGGCASFKIPGGLLAAAAVLVMGMGLLY